MWSWWQQNNFHGLPSSSLEQWEEKVLQGGGGEHGEERKLVQSKEKSKLAFVIGSNNYCFVSYAVIWDKLLSRSSTHACLKKPIGLSRGEMKNYDFEHVIIKTSNFYALAIMQ